MKNAVQPIGDILSELMAKTGFARIQSGEALAAAWRSAAGELAARYSRAGSVKRGKLEIVVSNSTLLQELNFRKKDLIATLAGALPDHGIRDLKFRLGTM
jgi:predicted nucleic acid-binding Zn ribbon protein